MIEVKDDRCTAYIAFSYSTVERPDGEKVRVTTCDILCFGEGKYTPGGIHSPKDFRGYDIDTGKAYCRESDTFSKEVGRKLALKRALLRTSQFHTSGQPYPKTARTAIWEAYHNRGKI